MQDSRPVSQIDFLLVAHACNLADVRALKQRRRDEDGDLVNSPNRSNQKLSIRCRRIRCRWIANVGKFCDVLQALKCALGLQRELLWLAAARTAPDGSSQAADASPLGAETPLLFFDPCFAKGCKFHLQLPQQAASFSQDERKNRCPCHGFQARKHPEDRDGMRASGPATNVLC